MIKKNYQLNRNKKFVDKAQQCFAFLHIRPVFQLFEYEVNAITGNGNYVNIFGGF